MLPTALTSFLVSLLGLILDNPPSPQLQPSLQFELRHWHAVSSSAHVSFSDVSRSMLETQASPGDPSDTTFTLNTRLSTTYKPSSLNAISEARIHSMKFGQSQSLPWEEDEVPAPDTEDRGTLLYLAKMANNAYVPPGDPAWYDLEGKWNSVRAPSIYSSKISRLTTFPNRTLSVLPVWLGGRRGWLQGPRLCNAR